jgi:hypothetical protein
MKKFLSFIFRQYDIGQGWGAFSQTLAQITVFVTFFNTALLIPTAYVTWFAPWALGLGVVVPFTIFVSAIFIVGIPVLLVGYKVLTPSSFVFWNEQWYQHGNLLKERLDIRDKEINEQHERICKKIDSIETELKKLRVALLKKNRNE